MAMTTYAVEWQHKDSDYWTRPDRLQLREINEQITNSFTSYVNAKVQLDRYADYHGRTGINYRIVDIYTGAVAVSTAGEDTTMAQKPLNVTRTKLITALEKAVKDEQAAADEARADALKKFDERVAVLRETASAAVLSSTANTIAGYLVEDNTKVHSSYQHSAVAKNETVEKQLRVLRLSEDKTVEVTPADDFYRYL
jgi:hypothetical protein